MTVLDAELFYASADPECAAVLRDVPELDPAVGLVALRERGRQVLDDLGELPVPEGVTRSVGELRSFVPDTVARDDAAVLWIHGGGLVAGEPRQDDLLCAALALEHRVPVMACSYRLAPENPYPAGLDDCLAALRTVLSSYGHVVVAGASAGGGLAVATAMRARDEGLPGVAGVVAHYPMLDDRPGRASMERVRFRKTWHAELDRMAWKAYLAGQDEVPALAAPARATTEELRGLPPTFLDVGTLDGFFDEDVAFAVQLARAGVPVDLCVTPSAFHASENLAPGAPTSLRIRAARRAAFARLLA
ncbi:MAG: alpha/beta hydrolase fold domain-containing protein [Nocardioidaceae bacterium]